MNKSKIKALVSIAYIDGFFDSSELYIINQRAKELGLENEEILEIIRSPDLDEFKIPITENEKLEFMYNLMEIIYADRIVDESEKIMFFKYLEKMNFNSDVFENIFDLMLKSIQEELSFEEFLTKNF